MKEINFEFLRGDTFYKKIRPTNKYKFQAGDKIHIAVMENIFSKNYLYEKEIEITEEKEFFELEILPSKTRNFPTSLLLLEIEVTYGNGIVKTNQYGLNVKGDGIYERN